MHKTGKELLKEIYSEHFGDLEFGAPDLWNNLAELANELSNLAGKTGKPWSAKYLYSILRYEQYSASKKILAALETFAAIYLDDASPMIAKLSKKVVYSRNDNLRPGSIILGKSVQCICGAWIVPRSWNGKYCSDDCRKEARRLRRRAT